MVIGLGKNPNPIRHRQQTGENREISPYPVALNQLGNGCIDRVRVRVRVGVTPTKYWQRTAERIRIGICG
jgi:hypothetical protein